jgi:hypothetical protein
VSQYKWVAYVENIYLDVRIVHLGVSDSFSVAVDSCLTEAQLAEHEEIVEQINAKPTDEHETEGTKIQGITFDNNDGIAYCVVPVHDLDDN